MEKVEWTVPRLRWILPLAQLLLCASILWPLRHEIVMQARGNAFAMSANQVQYLVDHGTKFNFITEQSQKEALLRERPLWIPAALNLPVMFAELPYDIFSKDHEELKPRGMNFLYWRALTWPVFGCFFWWLAGRNLEALIASLKREIFPRLKWGELMTNVLLALSGGVTAVCLFLERASHTGDMANLFWAGGLLWFALGSIGVAAWIKQRQFREKISQKDVPLHAT